MWRKLCGSVHDIFLRSLESVVDRFSLELKVESRGALNSLLDGSEVLAVLATGYGKRSYIFKNTKYA